MLTLMREESLFNPVIKSYANALGLTQIINSTGKIIAKRMKMKKYKFAWTLTDPRQQASIWALVFYLI
jgi:soluble lytic murein transglycosylase-like protein